jgi:hypothetical protein
MSAENVTRFYAALAQDEELRQKFAELFLRVQHQPVDVLLAARLVEAEVLPLAAAHGFLFSLEELRRHEETLWKSGGEISEADLQGVTGGAGDYFSALPFQGLLLQLFGPQAEGRLL